MTPSMAVVKNESSERIPGTVDTQGPDPHNIIGRLYQANAKPKPTLGDRLKQFPVSHYLVLPILLWAAFLRTPQIESVGVQLDESFNQRMVEFSWSEMFDRIGRDNHPPLFYVMLKLWSQLFGDSTGAGRLLSALWGIAGVAGIYAFVRVAYRRDSASWQENFQQSELPALVAAALLAMAPLHVIWAIQIRMYSLSVALAAWSSYFLFRALKPDASSASSWTAYTVTAILLSYTHYFGLFMLAAQYTYAIGSRWFLGRGSQIDRFSSVLLSMSLVALAWQPWLPYFLNQRDRVQREFTLLPEPSWNWLDRVSHELWLGMLAPYSPIVGLVLLQASFLLLLILIAGRRPADYFVVLAAATPAIAAVSISMMWRSIITAKYFLLGHAFLLVALAVVACRIPRIGRYVTIGLLIWGMFTACRTQQQQWEGFAQLPGMQAAAARIDVARGNEPLVISCPILYCCALTYLHDRTHVYNFQRPGGFPYWQGTAVIPNEKFVEEKWFQQTDSEYFWMVEADGRFLGRVTVPSGWRLVREEKYPEWYGTLLVCLYSRI